MKAAVTICNMFKMQEKIAKQLGKDLTNILPESANEQELYKIAGR